MTEIRPEVNSFAGELKPQSQGRSAQRIRAEAGEGNPAIFCDRPCCYCGLPMKKRGGPSKDLIDFYLQQTGGRYRLRKFIRHATSTKEHLVRKADGGTDARNNLEYAHAYCNSMRGETSVENHREAMIAAVSAGKHPLALLANFEVFL